MSNKNANLVSTCVLGVNLLLWCLLSPSAAEDVKVEGEPGENVLLQCQGTRDVTFLTWSKPDLKSDYFVYFFRNKQLDKDYQLQSFQDRVELKDPNMRNGDASIILKNISISDTGTYECSVGYGGSSELVSRVTLTVHPPAPTNATGERGGTVTLPCQVSSNRTIIVVEWTRTEPQTKGYIFLYRDEQIDPENQHLSLKNRLELKDSKMKDGDASLILKNLNTDDTGTYKCRVVQAGTKTWTSFTNLTVTDSGGGAA